MSRAALLKLADQAVDRCDLASARLYERLALMRPVVDCDAFKAGDIYEGDGGWFVLVDVVTREADGPMTREEAVSHGDSFGDAS
jgi:hypothetical protein